MISRSRHLTIRHSAGRQSTGRQGTRRHLRRRGMALWHRSWLHVRRLHRRGSWLHVRRLHRRGSWLHARRLHRCGSWLHMLRCRGGGHRMRLNGPRHSLSRQLRHWSLRMGYGSRRNRHRARLRRRGRIWLRLCHLCHSVVFGSGLVRIKL